MSNGKGDTARPILDKKKWNEEYERIFDPRNTMKQKSKDSIKENETK